MFLSTMYQEMPDVIYRKKQRQEEVMEAEHNLLAAAERFLAEIKAQEGQGKGQQPERTSGGAGRGQDRRQQQQQQQEQQQQEEGSCHLQ
jgi:hypothetical protein